MSTDSFTGTSPGSVQGVKPTSADLHESVVFTESLYEAWLTRTKDRLGLGIVAQLGQAGAPLAQDDGLQRMTFVLTS